MLTRDILTGNMYPKSYRWRYDQFLKISIKNIYRYIYIYIYIYCHPQTDLFRSIRTHQCGYIGKIPEAGIDTRLPQTPSQDSTTQPRGNLRKRRKFKRLWITIVVVYIYPLNGYRELDSYEELAYTLMATLQGLGSIYIYIYIYIYLFIYICSQAAQEIDKLWLQILQTLHVKLKIKKKKKKKKSIELILKIVTMFWNAFSFFSVFLYIPFPLTVFLFK